ncbi:MAG: dienelactone hydrolase family protein [Gammaproteobacteria bacterium]|nr:MAG: dienelactone hydrolase family protein [Gammaproteobacteria bacterium]
MRASFLKILFLSLFALPTWAGQLVTYTWQGQEFEGYFTLPAPGAPLILLIHDWDGLTDYEIKRADMLAEKGYAVFAADLFGKGIRPTENKDKRQHTGELYKDREKMRNLMRAALAEARRRGAAQQGGVAIGYCFGGAAVLELARAGEPLDGFVTFHGGLRTPKGQDYRKTTGTVMVFHGSADTAITMNDFATLAQQLESAGIKHEMTTYGGAPHAFTVFNSPNYRKDADQKSWARLLSYLEEVF